MPRSSSTLIVLSISLVALLAACSPGVGGATTPTGDAPAADGPDAQLCAEQAANQPSSTIISAEEFAEIVGFPVEGAGCYLDVGGHFETAIATYFDTTDSQLVSTLVADAEAAGWLLDSEGQPTTFLSIGDYSLGVSLYLDPVIVGSGLDDPFVSVVRELH